MRQEFKIALLGQPNSGKTSIFNALTNSRQHVGNWPGKTVEKREGICVLDQITCHVMDLPGSYSLAANSEEEIVTREFMENERVDLVVLLVDASQMERSMFMLADYAGIRIPAMLAVTMIDVAGKQGKKLNLQELERKLGIYVAGLVASDKNTYGDFLDKLRKALNNPKKLDASKLFRFYETKSGRELFAEAMRLVPEMGIGSFSGKWLAVKLLEQDEVVKRKVSETFGEEKTREFSQRVADGALYTSDCKFTWIEQMLEGCMEKKQPQGEILTKFDRMAVSERYGKWISVGVIFSGLALSMLAARPIMDIGNEIPVILKNVLSDGLSARGVSSVVIDFLNGTFVTALGWTVSMLGFVFGIEFVFGLIEEVGYMARVAYVFDRAMGRLGLQGKSIMPMIVSVGCTVGGVEGTRVVDSWPQRLLTMALTWAVPCGATFAVIPTLAAAFFGWGGILVMIFLFGIMLLHINFSARILGKRINPSQEKAGLIMELPPYHKPHFAALLQRTLSRMWEVFQKAFGVVLLASAFIYFLTYSAGGKVENTILYRVGIAMEPFTRFFGMRWQTFLAFLASMVSKEAVLGVLSTVYANSGSLFGSATGAVADGNFGNILVPFISKAEALAFMTAVTFNVPCVMAVTATYQESRSLKWTLRLVLYYFVIALLLAFVVYHLAALIL